MVCLAGTFVHSLLVTGVKFDKTFFKMCFVRCFTSPETGTCKRKLPRMVWVGYGTQVSHAHSLLRGPHLNLGSSLNALRPLGLPWFLATSEEENHNVKGPRRAPEICTGNVPVGAKGPTIRFACARASSHSALPEAGYLVIGKFSFMRVQQIQKPRI